jgi:crossover junction endodeoxyribonuclease RusA
LSIKLHFSVIGTPQPQGSSRAFIPKGWKRAIITSANSKLKPWRQEIAGIAQCEMEKRRLALIEGVPISVRADFFFDRPKSVKKLFKLTKPDCDKLLRGLFDALTGVVFKDDSQVVECTMTKGFGLPSRVDVFVEVKESLPLSSRRANMQEIDDF